MRRDDVQENVVSCSSESLETAAKYSGSCSEKVRCQIDGRKEAREGYELSCSWRRCWRSFFKSVSISLNALMDSSLSGISKAVNTCIDRAYLGGWGGPISTVSAVAMIECEVIWLRGSRLLLLKLILK